MEIQCGVRGRAEWLVSFDKMGRVSFVMSFEYSSALFFTKTAQFSLNIFLHVKLYIEHVSLSGY